MDELGFGFVSLVVREELWSIDLNFGIIFIEMVFIDATKK